MIMKNKKVENMAKNRLSGLRMTFGRSLATALRFTDYNF